MPDSGSTPGLQVNSGRVVVTVAPAAGVAGAPSVGGVRSTLTVAVAVPDCPSASVDVPVTTCPAPSPSATGAGHHAPGPGFASAHANETVVAAFVQARGFAAGACEAVTTGAVRSLMNGPANE